MYYRIIFLVGLNLLLGLNVHAVQSRGPFRYLTEPAVKWNGSRMSGQLRNVPVSEVLEDLLRGKDSECEVNGYLKDVVTVVFHDLSPEEIIRKIMRVNGYNYTMLVNESAGSSEPETAGEVMELTIYRDAGIVHFARVRRPTAAVAAAAKPAFRQDADWGVKPVPADPPPHIDTRHLDKEIRSFLDEMLAAEKIGREEYDKALKDVLGSKP